MNFEIMPFTLIFTPQIFFLFFFCVAYAIYCEKSNLGVSKVQSCILQYAYARLLFGDAFLHDFKLTECCRD